MPPVRACCACLAENGEYPFTPDAPGRELYQQVADWQGRLLLDSK